MQINQTDHYYSAAVNVLLMNNRDFPGKIATRQVSLPIAS